MDSSLDAGARYITAEESSGVDTDNQIGDDTDSLVKMDLSEEPEGFAAAKMARTRAHGSLRGCWTVQRMMIPLIRTAIFS